MKKKFKVSGVILTEEEGMTGERGVGEGGVYVLAYKPVWIHSSQQKSCAEQHMQAQKKSV